MRNIIVSGNLATDPEILTRQDGSSYTKLRIGNHEYSDGQNGNTKWFTVFYPRTDGIINALKKGSGVIVIGDYNDNIYQSQNGTTTIDRSISASKIDFFSTGKRDDAQTQQQTQQAQPQTTPTQTTETKPKSSPKPKAAAPAPAPEGVDDLPF